ncbi:hypothetical protein F4806DRAFT_467652 [Annulohypoxylon nitens]|nr:hypothetical protein F4806DRAFT_467652 [Annulohypoxylon nitens]
MIDMSSSPTMGHFSDSQGLLGADKDMSSGRNSEDIESYVRTPKRRSLGDHCGPWIIHLFLACVYTAIFFAIWDQTKPESEACPASYRDPSSQAYTPAWKSLKWETQMLDNQLDNSNPYKGLPRPEFEKAWDELLEPAAIKVDKETLERINHTSVPLLDGSGYMAALDVFHQLHCLRWVRKYLHPEHYEIKEKNFGQHIDHCLENLRQYVMCNADLSINTFEWIPNFRRPWPNFQVTHECANWDSIKQWAWANSFNGYDDNLIKHPDFHPELPDPFDYAAGGNDV